MSTVQNGQIVTNGLVLALDAANPRSYTSGSLVWNDLTSNAQTSSLVNGPSFNSTNGGNIVFDGTNDYATLNPNLIPTGNQITVGVWNYGLVAKASSVMSCFKDTTSTGRTVNIHIPWSDSIVYWDCGYGPGFSGYDRISTSTLASSEWQNSWHYWAFTKNATTGIMRIYLDGILKTEGTGKTQAILTSNFSNLAVWQLSDYHQGYISNFHIYNRSLSPAEVLQNYNATKTRFGL